MGPCSGKQNQRDVNDKIDILPYTTQGVLNFNIRISNMKIKARQLSKCKLIFKIANIKNLETEYAQELYDKIYFKTQFNTEIEASEDDLRRNNLEICIVDQNQQQIANVTINMYRVATGPQHFDYKFQEISSPQKKGKLIEGRLSFDFKMAQIVDVQVSPKFLEFTITEGLTHENYAYQLKMVTSSITFQSEYSGVYHHKIDIKQANNKILWIKDQVALNVEVPLIEITSSSIQICLWFIKNNVEDAERYQLVCETYLNLAQIFNQALNEEFSIENGSKVYRYLSKQNNKRLWNHGIQEGSLDCQFEFLIPSYLQQQVVGVRTDVGIQQGSTVVNQNQASNKEIKELMNQCQKLFDNQFKLLDKQLEIKQRLLIKDSYRLIVPQIMDLLKSTDKQSIKSFVYKSQQELFEAQNILIRYATKFLEAADQQEEKMKEDFYEILTLFVNRGELILNQVGFSVETERTIDKLKGMKNEVGANYQIFLYKTLDHILHKLKQKSLGDKERLFIETFVAGAYFKIPEFQEKIVKSVEKADDIDLPEWRSLTKTNNYENRELVDLFDWNKHFYNYLKQQRIIFPLIFYKAKYEQYMEYLKNTLNESEWQKRIGKRGLAFFFFLKEWHDYVCVNVVQKDRILWQSLPGYSNLIKGFLLELRARDLKSYPEAMKQTLCIILYNNTLVNIVIVILFRKTRLFDTDEVQTTFEILNQCFQFLISHKIQLPSQLDKKFFLSGIKMILEKCDHASCISKCLWFLYNNYTIFPIDIKKEICDYIFETSAIRYFMHWSINVRSIFHHLLLFRVWHLHKTNKDMNERDIMENYKKQMEPRKNHSYLMQKTSQIILISDMIYMKYFSFIQIIEEGKRLSNEQQKNQLLEERNFHKAMRQKLIQQKVQKRKTSQEQDLEIRSQSSQYFIINKDEDEIEYRQMPNMLNPQDINEFPQIKQKSVQNKETKIKLTQQQLKYMVKANLEFDELKSKYTKWRQQKIPANYIQLNDEDKMAFNESMVVPEVKLSVPNDGQESNIVGADEW